MKAEVLRKEFDRCGSLHKLVLHYLHTLIVTLSQSAALISYRRGRIAIRGRSRLEAAACECDRFLRA
jgi:hypothetical protein